MKNKTKKQIKIKKQIKQLSILITISGIMVLTWLMLNKDIARLMEKPISYIGNIPQNYLFFLIGSGIVFYFVNLFLIKLHIKENIKISWELYSLPVLVFLMLIIPYNDEQIIAKILHTVAGIIGAIILLFLMYKINKYLFPQNKTIKKLTKNIPKITFIGTIAIFLLTGLNTIMQLFFLFMSLIWINIIAFTKTKSKENEKREIKRNKQIHK